jgi:O-antigen/teichoic acid export membrane protein
MDEPSGSWSRSAIAAATRHGVAWKLASLTITHAVRLVALVVIARALEPRELGLAVLALSCWALVGVVMDFALAAALVQRREIDEAARSTAFWSGVALGVVLATIGVASSGPIASLFGEPRLRWLIVALGAGMIVNALTTVQVALLTRAMDFRTLELAGMAATTAGAAVGISLALSGAGPWAIVGDVLTGSAVYSSLLWLRSDWRPQRLFSRESLRDVAGFATLLTSTRLVVGVQRALDRLLIGNVFGAGASGTYSIAASIVSVPAARLVDPIRGVLFPAFSRLQATAGDLADAWLRTTRVLCALLTPLLVTLVLGADELVEVVLGDRWAGAAPLLEILAVAALFQLAGALNAVALAAADRLAIVLVCFLAALSISIAGFALASGDLENAVVGYAAGPVLVAPVYLALTARALAVPVRALLSAYAPAAAGSVGMLVVAGWALPEASSAAGRLATIAVAGFAAYALLAFASSRPLRADLRRAIGRSAARMAAEAS